MSRVEKAAQTKRARLEAEFGIPFEKAQELRQMYYVAGYGACRERLKPIEAENRVLRERVRLLRLQLDELRKRAVA